MNDTTTKSVACDRRQSLRYPLGTTTLPCRVAKGSQAQATHVVGQNISTGGLGMVVDHHLTPGTVLHFENPLERNVEILHSVRRPDGRWLVGGVFAQPLEEDVACKFLPPEPIVLVIEEDVEVREVIDLTFQAGGPGVWPVASGKEGLAVVRKHAHELALVLIDVGLNGQAGKQTLASIQRLAPALPCWLMTGGTDFSESDLKTSGASRLLLKPLNFKEVIASIHLGRTR